MVVKLEQVGQLVEQDGPGFGHDDLLYSNLSEKDQRHVRQADGGGILRAQLSSTSVSFTLSGLQTPSVM